jgi:hypothetical protein
MTYSPRWVLNGLDLTSAPFMVVQDSADPGTAESVSAILASMIADGEIQLTQRRGNRTYELPVAVEGIDRATIATAQADLATAAEKAMGTLEFDPGDGSDVTVFETFEGSVALSNGTDDTAATNGLQRYTLTIPCRPFVRPSSRITIDAPPLPGGTPPTDTTIDSGSSTSGYSATGLAGTTNTVGLGGSDPFLTGTVYSASVRVGSTPVNPWNTLTRTATIAVDSTRPYLLIKGKVRYRHDVTGNYGYAGDISITAASGSSFAPLTLINMQHNSTTGAFTALVQQNSSIDSLTVKLQTPSSFRVARYSMWTAVDSITRTAGSTSGVFTGKVQSRQVQIYGSQRTELSLSVLGLDPAGSSPIALGAQTLIHTATAGSDGRSKFLGCRDASGATGVVDIDAVTGVKTTLGTTASPTLFSFPASALIPGEYDLFASLKGSAGPRTISYAAALDGAGSLNSADPPTGWYTAQVTAATTYRIIPLGSLMLPPAGIEDPNAIVTVKVASSSAVDLDEIWLAHRESGQVTLLDTNDPGLSAVRLDAATLDRPQPSAWVGVASDIGTGAMMAAGVRIQAFDQHMAEQGLLQISTVTPGCSSSRVSASYFPRYAHDVAPLPQGIGLHLEDASG